MICTVKDLHLYQLVTVHGFNTSGVQGLQKTELSYEQS